MSLYQVSKLLYSLNDPEVRGAFIADPKAYLQKVSGLTLQEANAVADHDVRTLHEMGISIYLIRSLEYVHGVSLVETGVATGGNRPVGDNADEVSEGSP